MALNGSAIENKTTIELHVTTQAINETSISETILITVSAIAFTVGTGVKPFSHINTVYKLTLNFVDQCNSSILPV